MFVYLSGDGDVHFGYGVLTHGQLVSHKIPTTIRTGCIRFPEFLRK